jgi:hypothetical protein
LGTNHIKLDSRHLLYVRTLVTAAVLKGIPEVDIQLCRLLSNSNISPNERKERMQANPRN